MALIEHDQAPEVRESEQGGVQQCQVDGVFQVKHSGCGIRASHQLLGRVLWPTWRVLRMATIG